MCILGIVRLRNLALLAFCGSFIGVAGCSTDFDYLRAGNNVSGAGGDQPDHGVGGTGTGGSSDDDAGENVDSSVADADEDAFDAGDVGRDARDARPRPVPTGVLIGVAYPTTQLAPSSGGMNYTDTCPQDKVAVGFNGTVDSSPTPSPTSLQSL